MNRKKQSRLCLVSKIVSSVAYIVVQPRDVISPSTTITIRQVYKAKLWTNLIIMIKTKITITQERAALALPLMIIKMLLVLMFKLQRIRHPKRRLRLKISCTSKKWKRCKRKCRGNNYIANSPKWDLEKGRWKCDACLKEPNNLMKEHLHWDSRKLKLARTHLE